MSCHVVISFIYILEGIHMTHVYNIIERCILINRIRKFTSIQNLLKIFKKSLSKIGYLDACTLYKTKNININFSFKIACNIHLYILKLCKFI